MLHALGLLAPEPPVGRWRRDKPYLNAIQLASLYLHGPFMLEQRPMIVHRWSGCLQPQHATIGSNSRRAHPLSRAQYLIAMVIKHRCCEHGSTTVQMRDGRCPVFSYLPVAVNGA